ncbi:unnamed protein product [Adineta steineri]|uniref:Uncharacterized protein n=1 Tax=Adineta steineri TaxID=433720 RepID=A0A818U3S5_9BILA|nr:unnamed protein product [Adineta steineri]CAF1027195.1 unnamed protein product [Adineta steineri]CAF3605483.1 unnamed protein product [Adineta steineri]CAF3691870.1 unnamed protein product [Adineta steineri]
MMMMMMTMFPIILLVFIISFDTTYAASSCYSCNPCGTTWNPSAANVIQTSGLNDYCRKTVTGTLVVKDSVSTCNSVNILNNGVYCCQTDLCNTANKYSPKLINLGFFILGFLLKIYYEI